MYISMYLDLYLNMYVNTYVVVRLYVFQSIYIIYTCCATVWVSTYFTNLNRIFLLQKRAVRAITNSDYTWPTQLRFSLTSKY